MPIPVNLSPKFQTHETKCLMDTECLRKKGSHSVVSDSLRPMGCSLPGSSVHGLFQARVLLEWLAISFSGESSRPRDQTQVSRIAGRCFYHLSHQGSSRLRFPFIPQGSFLSQSPAMDFPSAFWMIICRFLSIYKTKIIFLLLFLFLSQRRALTKNMVISKTHQTSGQKS